MAVKDFSELADKFREITERIVWCTVATADRQGRPRSPILHPIWQGHEGWLATGRRSHKTTHLVEGNPYVSLSNWDPQHEQTIIDRKAAWQDDAAARQWLWQIIASTPPLVGYNPSMFWKNPDDEDFGVLKLTPWRLGCVVPGRHGQRPAGPGVAPGGVLTA